MLTPPPLALYVHFPWCVKKCPYCDFNSHTTANLPEAEYVDALRQDLLSQIDGLNRPITSIFIGGGTPSLISPQGIADTLDLAERTLGFSSDIEITLEANPGTAESTRFKGYKAAGINRLSIGVQSFDDLALSQLGRIHSSNEAYNAFKMARNAGFDNINLDLMHGLPGQSVTGAIRDLEQALRLEPEHISWYQLTIEPNTAFFNQPPSLPADDLLADIEDAGFSLLAEHHFNRYEVSAFAQQNKSSRHNLNYWLFGDYLGIGAGAHGKISRASGSIHRTQKSRAPNDFMAKPTKTIANQIPSDDLVFEFMLNALRLIEGSDVATFTQRTGLNASVLQSSVKTLSSEKLMHELPKLQTTELGFRFLNDVVNRFSEAN